MAMKLTKDNSTLRRKISLRKLALEQIDQPVIMETHGGYGRIFLECYSKISQGVVFEKDDRKSGVLSEQRPTWAVYQADCLPAIRGGVGAHLPVNFLDVDPYGDPWQVITAFLDLERPKPEKLVIVVNDGLRRNTMMNFSWRIESLDPMLDKYGNDLYPIYKEVCQELMQQKAEHAGYSMHRFVAYYCGHNDLMTHYLAVLIRDVSEGPPSGSISLPGTSTTPRRVNRTRAN